MKNTQVRFARPNDLEQLAQLRAALWPESSAEEHGQELELILAGKSTGVMPLVILVAEAATGRWQVFWRPNW